MEKPSFKLDAFEGPLDLLLHLITKHKLNIYDIEISVLLEQYMAYIDHMKSENLDVASEFLEMAARLVYIKTAALLPKHEEAQTLKNELTGELLEYKTCQEAAKRLEKRSVYGKTFVRQPIKLPVNKIYSRIHSPNELVSAYLAVLGKAKRKLPPPISAFGEMVVKRVVSVESRVIVILKKLYRNSTMNYDDFYRSGDRSELVATFLAMLELIKSSRITVSDDNKTVYFDRLKQKRQQQRKEFSANES